MCESCKGRFSTVEILCVVIVIETRCVTGTAGATEEVIFRGDSVTRMWLECRGCAVAHLDQCTTWACWCVVTGFLGITETAGAVFFVLVEVLRVLLSGLRLLSEAQVQAALWKFGWAESSTAVKRGSLISSFTQAHSVGGGQRTPMPGSFCRGSLHQKSHQHIFKAPRLRLTNAKHRAAHARCTYQRAANAKCLS